MTHYIYLEENRIAYTRGNHRHIGRAGAPAFSAQSKVRDTKGIPLEAVFKELSDEFGLCGKNVTLVLGQDLSFMGMVLPRGRKSVVKGMACNQLVMKAGLRDVPAVGVDIRNGKARRKVLASLYYMEEKRLVAYKEAAAAAGMVCTRIVAVPDCMALTAQEIWKERSHLVVDVEEEQLGLYLVSKGHCLAFSATALRAKRFCEMGGESLLYEEIAERAQRLFKLASRYENEDPSDPGPECAVLLGGCIPSADKGASALEALLQIPCFARTLADSTGGEGFSPQKAVTPSGLLAACLADHYPGKRKPVSVNGINRMAGAASFRGIRGILSKGWTVFLVINAVAALGSGIWVGVEERKAAGRLDELRIALVEPEYREAYQRAVDMEEELKRLADREAVWDAVKAEAAGKNLLSMDALRAFTDSMDPDMEVESVSYEGENETLSMTISMSNRGQIPLYVERLNEAGIFPHVNHSLWEQKEEEGKPERLFVVVSASLTEGGMDETQ